MYQEQRLRSSNKYRVLSNNQCPKPFVFVSVCLSVPSTFVFLLPKLGYCVLLPSLVSQCKDVFVHINALKLPK